MINIIKISLIILIMTIFQQVIGQESRSVFPEENWKFIRPEKAGLNSDILDSVAVMLGGRGCIVKNGYMVKIWGDSTEKSDWLSSVKPLFSTLLFFAIEEGLIPDVHYKIYNLGWDLLDNDRDMEFYHLANMTSGYARPEKPGEAWAYNDYAIQLYQKCLFERVFKEPPAKILSDRLGCLNFQDSIWFSDIKPRIYASVRDFARIGLFWMNLGNWNGKQVLPKMYFEKYMKPQVAKTLPNTSESKIKNNDYLKIGTFGGGSDHFTPFGAGIYGFNWWFNNTGLLHPDKTTWPNGTSKTFMSIGAGGNNMLMIPEYQLILASAKGNWGELNPGDHNNKFNICVKLLLSSIM